MTSSFLLLRLRPLRRKAISGSRLYHSYDHPAPPAATFNRIETAILEASIPHIAAKGFTQAALSRGARDAGYLDASTNIFPRGPFTLVHYHLVTQRLCLAQQFHVLQPSEHDEPPLDIISKVKAITWARLLGNADIIHRWQEALALMAQPSNVTTSVAELSRLVDEICFLSGDISVDSSWYTKRASLSTIYASTEVFMTTDKSHGFEETRSFMDRRFSDAQNIGMVMGTLGQWVGFTAHAGLNVLRSKGIRL